MSKDIEWLKNMAAYREHRREMAKERKQYVMVCVARADGQETPLAGMFLKSFDPEAFGGRGHVDWTSDKAKAMKFDSIEDGFKCWVQIPESRPLRPDLRPNKPLTAFTISVEPLHDEDDELDGPDPELFNEDMHQPNWHPSMGDKT